MYLKKLSQDLPAVLYAIYFFKQSKLTINDIESINNKLRRCRKKYPYISYLLTISNTESNHCVKRKIKTKKRRDRPPIRVIGKKTYLHVHLAVIGDKEHSAYKCVKEIKEMFNKRCQCNCCNFYSKGRKQHAKNFINYILKQSLSVRKNGIFNEILEKRNTIETNYL